MVFLLLMILLKLFPLSNCLHLILAIPTFRHFAILIYRYIFASLLQNYYNFVIYQSIFAKISIKFLTFAKN